MASAEGDMKALLNAKQLVQKISANSMYGLTGANTGLLRTKEIAKCTTAYGRTNLHKTRELAMEAYPLKRVIKSARNG